MIRTVLLITGSLQNIEKAGSGINILYLLTGPISFVKRFLTSERPACTYGQHSFSQLCTADVHWVKKVRFPILVKLAFHDDETDTDNDFLADILARIVARMPACRSACHRNNFKKIARVGEDLRDDVRVGVVEFQLYRGVLGPELIPV